MEFPIPDAARNPAWNDKAGLRDVEEEHECTACEGVEGTVPEWMNGSLYRQSGGAFHSDAEEAFLDGLAHLTAFHIGASAAGGQAGGVTFSNKYMRTAGFRKFVTTGAREWAGTAAVADKSGGGGAVARAVQWVKQLVFGADKSGPPALYKGFNPNVTVWDIGGERMAAITEVDEVCEFDPRTLSTLGSVTTFDPKSGPAGSAATGAKAAQVITTAAHWFQPLVSSGGEAKNAFHVNLELAWSMTLKGPVFTFAYGIYHGSTPPFAKVAHHELCSFPWAERAKQPLSKRAAYMHAVGQTSNYFVAIAGSWRMRYESLLANDFSNGFFGLFDRAKDAPVHFLVYKILDQAQGSVEFVDQIECPEQDIRGMLWHVGNCFESAEGTKINIDCSYSPVPEDETVAAGVGADLQLPGDIRRFTIDLAGKTVATKALAQGVRTADKFDNFEFPNINPRFYFKPNRYTYAINDPLRVGSTIVKVDAEDGVVTPLKGLGDDEIPTEPVFVPRPGAAPDAELDGVVLVEALHATKNVSHLCVVDPTTFTITARVKAPVTANFGLHSVWKDHGDVDLANKY